MEAMSETLSVSSSSDSVCNMLNANIPSLLVGPAILHAIEQQMPDLHRIVEEQHMENVATAENLYHHRLVGRRINAVIDETAFQTKNPRKKRKTNKVKTG